MTFRVCSIVIAQKKIFQLQIYLQIFAISTDFFLNYNHIKNRFGQNLVLRKNSRFSVNFFFLFFSIFLKTVGKCLLFTRIMHQGYSFCHQKPPPKFEIEALFLQVMFGDAQKTRFWSACGAFSRWIVDRASIGHRDSAHLYETSHQDEPNLDSKVWEYFEEPIFVGLRCANLFHQLSNCNNRAQARLATCKNQTGYLCLKRGIASDLCV
ncbi:hypothetical protein AGLY_008110 [Aphis glycines]|uniref:Uncharacterized protein n=1 Tax=Aphis glycines TaxID=307491 RepID=A0A6G0TL42_APHGL|nr:hypothetical protein AGLY_008110 [Aphis glycines]